VTDDAGTEGARLPKTVAQRLMPLQVAVFLQGCMLWVPVEKLFQTQIGFDAASIGLMAAAYAAVVPLLEVPSGILADRWSRNGIMVAGSIALAASSLIGGLSTDVATYIVAAMILGVYFALSSGTVDSVVYDAVLEQTGSSAAYENWIGRVRIVESVALAGSALVGGVLADWTSTRLTYLATVPFALASVVAFGRFDEPRLHRTGSPDSWRRHMSATFRAMIGLREVRRVMLLAALTGLLSQTVFEFGPLWLVALRAPATAFGPYWAVLVATLGLGGYLTSRLSLGRPLPVGPWPQGLPWRRSCWPRAARCSRSSSPSAPCSSCWRSSPSTPGFCCTTRSPPTCAPACPPGWAPCPGCSSCPSRWPSAG
jgi:MFS family permease